MNAQAMMGYSSRSYSGAANYQVSSTGGNYSFNNVLLSKYVVDREQHGKYSVLDVANWFLAKSSMSHLKLQKLCYYAQAWAYALKDMRLMDTDFQAWVHGPVSPVLYEKFKSFGYDGIKIKKGYISKIAEEDEHLLESVWATYGGYVANALEVLTHRELPWIEARVGYRPDEKCQVVILPSTMKKYYTSIYNGESIE